MPAPGEVDREAAGAAPSSRIGSPQRSASSSQTVRSAAVGAALDVVPDRARLDALGSALIARTPSPGRGRRAACAAPAARCRWGGRRGAPGAAATAASSEAAMSGSTAIRSSGQPAYFSRSAISGARVPAQVTRRTAPASTSKSASQTQETSRPSAIRSFSAIQRSTGSARLGLQLQRAQDLVGARRVLDQQDRDRLPPTAIVSTRPKAARISRRAAATRSGVDPEPQAPRRSPPARCRRCRGRGGGARPRSRRPGARTVAAEPSMPRSSIRVAATSGRGRCAPQFGHE